MNGHDPRAHRVQVAAEKLRLTVADEQSRVGQYGDSPYDHRVFVGEVRGEWPDFWKAVDEVVEATK